jgi:CubicO group peptidase (beta-lactamase class C family)
MTRRSRIFAAVIFLTAVFAWQPLSGTASSSTVNAGLDENRLAAIDEFVQDAIRAHQLPGAVVVVGRRDRIYYRKAFGNRALAPAVEPMTVDTIFDLASLTKVVATTTSIMQLVDEGRIGLKNFVAEYIPEFARNGKSQITIFHLLTHTSGLKPGLDP